MIVRVAFALLAYELYAMRFKKPLVTDLSHTWPYSIGIYGFIAWLFVHCVRAGRKR